MNTNTEILTNQDTLPDKSALPPAAAAIALIHRIQSPQKSSHRRKLLRSIFNKTNKSPFRWGLGVSKEKNSVQKLIQRAHRQFWRTKAVSEATATDLQVRSGSPGTTEQLLAAIALCAYCPELRVEISEESQPNYPSLNFQLHQVELQLWNSLNSDRDFDGTGVVDRFEELTERILDGDGWPEAELFHEFGLLTASWLRCAMVFDHLGIAIDAATESRLDWLCRQLVRSMRHDGSLFFGEPNAGVNCRSFAKSLAHASLDNSIKKLLLQRAADKSGKGKKTIRNLPPASAVSEWAQASVLRSNWNLGSPAVGILFGQSKIDLELAHKFSIIAGNCTPSIWINGQLLAPSSEICVTCELEFDGLDILELELEYNEWRLQRQIVMMRDGLVLISDNVLGSEQANIEYRCEYPLAAGTEVIEESSTTEMYIRKGPSYALVLPLGLPEWQSERTEDRFLAQDGRLILTQSTDGQCLSAPLLFDMKPKRSLKPRTWRPLTVAENLEVVRKDVAVAFRFQIGKEQWLFYRSLGPAANRTFLGVNVVNEFFIGRIDLRGNIMSIAEVE